MYELIFIYTLDFLKFILDWLVLYMISLNKNDYNKAITLYITCTIYIMQIFHTLI